MNNTIYRINAQLRLSSTFHLSLLHLPTSILLCCTCPWQVFVDSHRQWSKRTKKGVLTDDQIDLERRAFPPGSRDLNQLDSFAKLCFSSGSFLYMSIPMESMDVEWWDRSSGGTEPHQSSCMLKVRSMWVMMVNRYREVRFEGECFRFESSR